MGTKINPSGMFMFDRLGVAVDGDGTPVAAVVSFEVLDDIGGQNVRMEIERRWAREQELMGGEF